MSSNNLDKPNISKPLKKINKSNELATSSESNESTKLTKPTTSTTSTKPTNLGQLEEIFNRSLLYLIMFIHFAVLSSVIGIPLFGDYYFLLMHAIFIPFMVVHWILNDSTCALSIMEVEIRKKLGLPFDEQRCFIKRIIRPIYEFKQDHKEWTKQIYVITFSLWAISLTKLYNGRKNGDITSWKKLMQRRK